MTKCLLITLLLITGVYGQQSQQELIDAAQTAIKNNDLAEAKGNLRSLVNTDPKNRDFWKVLANLEVHTNERNLACEHYYKAYQLGDFKARDSILKYCPDFRDGRVLFLAEVDTGPKFVSEDQEFEVFNSSGANLGDEYLKLMTRRIKRSAILKSKLSGRTVISFHINSSGFFDGRILRLACDPKDTELVSVELLGILANTVKYIPAKKNGVNVELWERFQWPIVFD